MVSPAAPTAGLLLESPPSGGEPGDAPQPQTIGGESGDADEEEGPGASEGEAPCITVASRGPGMGGGPSSGERTGRCPLGCGQHADIAEGLSYRVPI